jgi:hypothetical protein
MAQRRDLPLCLQEHCRQKAFRSSLQWTSTRSIHTVAIPGLDGGRMGTSGTTMAALGRDALAAEDEPDVRRFVGPLLDPPLVFGALLRCTDRTKHVSRLLAACQIQLSWNVGKP